MEDSDESDARELPINLEPEEIGSKSKWRNWTIVGAFAALALVVALVADATTIWSNVSGHIGGTPETNTSESFASDGLSPKHESSETVKAISPKSDAPNDHQDGCYQAEENSLKQISCDAPHTAEIFASSQGCTQEALIKFLGGSVNIDVPRQDLHLVDLPESNCLLTFPPEVRLSGSAAKVLAGHSSESMRQCYDAKTNRNVGCDATHTAEVVKVYSAGSTVDSNCLKAAEDYLGLGLDGFSNQLSVELELSNQARRCLVSVKGDNVLTATLRNTTHSALPIASDTGMRD